jgi:hypothetical protein
MTGAELASFLTTKTDNVIEVAYNPATRRIEQVFPEDEVFEDDVFKMYWANSLGRYVSIPD